MFALACPKCERQMNLPETSRGKRIRCLGCQEIVLAVTEPPPRPVAPFIFPLPSRTDSSPHAATGGVR